MVTKRKSITALIKRQIWEKTGGRCHICGRVLIFDATKGEIGKWNVDHIIPFTRGGKDNSKNFLPICKVCNRLKWHFKGRKIRKLFQFGIIALRESKYRTGLGKSIIKIYKNKSVQNKNRRKGKLPSWYYR